jgi:hypothetical protein
MHDKYVLFDIDPRSTLPIDGQQQKWVTLLTQLLSNDCLGIDDPSITPLDLLIRCADHFVFTLVRHKRTYRNPKGELVCPSLIFRVLITAYREPVSKQTTLSKKEHFFTIFHESLFRAHYKLE